MRRFRIANPYGECFFSGDCLQDVAAACLILGEGLLPLQEVDEDGAETEDGFTVPTLMSATERDDWFKATFGVTYAYYSENPNYREDIAAVLLSFEIANKHPNKNPGLVDMSLKANLYARRLQTLAKGEREGFDGEYDPKAGEEKSGEPEGFSVWLADVTCAELEPLLQSNNGKIVLDYLRKQWVGKYPDRDKEIRVGSLTLVVEGKEFCIKLIPRFYMENEDKADLFKRLERPYAGGGSGT